MAACRGGLTSRRKRGLSGMKVSPTREVMAGRAATRMKTLQLWNWNSVPILKPQPVHTHTHTQTHTHTDTHTRVKTALICCPQSMLQFQIWKLFSRVSCFLTGSVRGKLCSISTGDEHLYVLTISGDDAPGGEGGVDPTDHPEHTQPGQMLSSLVHLEELREVRVHDGYSSTDSERRQSSTKHQQAD